MPLLPNSFRLEELRQMQSLLYDNLGAPLPMPYDPPFEEHSRVALFPPNNVANSQRLPAAPGRADTVSDDAGEAQEHAAGFSSSQSITPHHTTAGPPSGQNENAQATPLMQTNNTQGSIYPSPLPPHTPTTQLSASHQRAIAFYTGLATPSTVSAQGYSLVDEFNLDPTLRDERQPSSPTPQNRRGRGNT